MRTINPFKAFKMLSINRKFVFCLCLFIILPLLAAFYIVYINYTDDLKEKYDERIHLLFKEKALRTGDVIQDLDNSCLQIMYNDRNIRQLERYYSLGDAKNYERVKNNVNTAIRTSPLINIYDGSISISRDENILYQYGKDSIKYEQPMSFKDDTRTWGRLVTLTQYSDNQLYRSNAKVPMISVIRKKFINTWSKYPLVFRVNVEESLIYGIIADTVYGSHCFLVDDNGMVMSAKDKAILGTSIYDRVGLKNGDIKANSHSRVSADIGGSGYQKYLMLSYNDALTGSNLVYFVPAAAIDTQTSLTATLTIVAVCVCIVFGILFYTILSKSVIRPINHLKTEMVKIGEGDDKAVATNGGDEIRLLSDSFEDMKARINDLIEHVYKLQIKEKEAQLQALMSQINPHFLYNTLDSIRFSAILNQDSQVAEQIETLSNIFRHTLSFEGEVTTIKSEIMHLKNYIYIQQLRFGERISYDISCPDELLECESLKLLLQPLCENAILHGHESVTEHGNVWVRVFEEDEDTLVLEVEDDGVGVDEEIVRQELEDNNNPSSMIALKGIQDRIRIKYGDNYGMNFCSTIGKGTKVSARIPKKG